MSLFQCRENHRYPRGFSDVLIIKDVAFSWWQDQISQGVTTQRDFYSSTLLPGLFSFTFSVIPDTLFPFFRWNYRDEAFREPVSVMPAFLL